MSEHQRWVLLNLAENIAKWGHESPARVDESSAAQAAPREKESNRSSRNSEPSKHEKLEREKQIMLVMDEMIRQVSEFTAEEKIVDFIKISKKPVLSSFAAADQDSLPPPRRSNWEAGDAPLEEIPESEPARSSERRDTQEV